MSICVVLPSRPLDGFILAEQARDLMRADGVVMRPPPRWLRYGVTSRLPEPLARLVGRWQARRMARGERVACVVIYHPAQWYVARGLLSRGAELWYWRWDRYEVAYQTRPGRQRRLAKLHEVVAARSAMVLTVSVELQRLEQAPGREAILAPLSADTFPAPDPLTTRTGVWRGPPPSWDRVRELALRTTDTVLLLAPGAAPANLPPNVVTHAGDADRLAALADYALDFSG